MLKSLELFGFKSFADRTRFDFSTGINCVVGPNGSGKSNVVDAMKWILGDQSAKSLRGKEMTDVIFNGSSSRKPSAYAEATLTFDNSTGFLPLDMQEVHIGRRIWRNGDSEYLLNRATARLKDIRDLFLGTGAGSSAYSIIEQGRVDQILQGNSTSRRAVFEEAAGISRFKTRKVEAQKKLERVAQNLERLTDIVDEVEAQLNSTRSQAAKAAKYHDLSTTLKKWWQGLAADDFRHLSAELGAIELQSIESQQMLDALNEQQKVFESREAAFDADFAQLEDELREIDRRSSVSREAIAGHEATIQFQSARLQELESELIRLQAQQVTLARRAQETLAEIARQTDEISESEVDHATNRQRLEEQSAQLEAANQDILRRRKQLDLDRARRLELTRLVSNHAHLVSVLRSNIAASVSTLQKIQSQRGAVDGTIAERELERARAAARVDEATQNQSLAMQNLRTAQLRRANLLEVQENAKQQLAELRERRSALQARKSLLEDLELRQEGLGIGVKEILSRARTSPVPPWNSIVGSVADLLDVDLESAALLEVALGSRAQLIVLKEYQPLLDYLNLGVVQLTNRVGFIAVPDQPRGQAPLPVQQNDRFIHLQIHPDALPDLSAEPGVLMRADKLVLSDRGSDDLAAAILSDTWVVQSIETAISLATGAGHGLRFVSLQGELLESNGTLYVGTVRSETSLLSRKSELRRLKNDLSLLDRDIAVAEQSLQGMYQSLTGADTELEALAAEIDYANQWLADLKLDLGNLDQTLERLRSEQQSLSRQLREGEEERIALEEEWKSAEEQALNTEEELRLLEMGLGQAEEAILVVEQQNRELEQKHTDDQLDLVKQGERLQSLRSQLNRLKEELTQRTYQYEEAERRCQVAVAKRSQIALQILNTRAIRDEKILVAEQIQAMALSVNRKKMNLRAERSLIVEQELALRKERRDVADRHHANEIRMRDIRNSLENLNQRLEEEYQLKLSDAVESGLSAHALYLEERASKPAHHRHKHRRDDADETVEAPTEVISEDNRATVGDATHGHESRIENVEIGADSYADVRPELDARVNRMRKQLKLMGAVNIDSLQDLQMQETRFLQLSAQLQDLVEAKLALEDIIRKINTENRRIFIETFETIRKNFQELFRQVFGGGEGDIILEDPNDVLECGIDIAARPPGKELRSISLLSGGEKTMTAIGLIMAIFKSKPSPFCILDEVDAALDEANVERFTAVVKQFQQSTQFIMITHHKRSMTIADLLYGVTMEESGVSKRMSVRFEDVSDDGHFTVPPQTSAA